jgi:hypothetical protein
VIQRSGRDDGELRMLRHDLKRDLWQVFKGKRAIGLIRWNGSIPFRVRVKSNEKIKRAR